jgi:hypothetical protein
LHFQSSPPPKSLWSFAYNTFRNLGLSTVYAPLRTSLIKESLSYGAFFGVFEYIKQQGYYAFLKFYYGGYRAIFNHETSQNEMKPHWSLSPLFIILAGSSASIAFSAISFPLNKIQQGTANATISFRDFVSSPSIDKRITNVFKFIREGGLYRGFLGHAVRMIPGPSVALIIFEGMRRNFAPEGEGVWGGDIVVPIKN